MSAADVSSDVAKLAACIEFCHGIEEAPDGDEAQAALDRLAARVAQSADVSSDVERDETTDPVRDFLVLSRDIHSNPHYIEKQQALIDAYDALAARAAGRENVTEALREIRDATPNGDEGGNGPYSASQVGAFADRLQRIARAALDEAGETT